MKILVTGADGFVGGHLARELADAGHEVIQACGQQKTVPEAHLLDIRDPGAVRALVEATRPNGCIHLAGMAFVPQGWENPNLCFDININGTLHLLEAVRQAAPECRFLFISSAEVYGRKPTENPVSEDAPFDPENIYALSKVSADSMTLLYARRYELPFMTARPQNHVGPGQSEAFVFPSFARQVAAIARGESDPIMRVGNLDAERDFTDVRDIVRGYRLLVEQGAPGQAYNLATGKNIRVGKVLDGFCELAGVRPTIETDPNRFRPTDYPPVMDTTRIREQTGWTPAYTLEQTLADIYATVLDQNG